MTDTVYFWNDSGAWQLGRRVRSVPAQAQIGGGSLVPVQKLYDPPGTDPEWVPESKLSVYHGDNQPEGK